MLDALDTAQLFQSLHFTREKQVLTSINLPFFTDTELWSQVTCHPGFRAGISTYGPLCLLLRAVPPTNIPFAC